ncbi:MAG TPA: hypothetical protein VKB95_10755, partial [Chitinophagaceae bacterium]|nr:hypothetical protein [Chitinophagaceae bacterium]
MPHLLNHLIYQPIHSRFRLLKIIFGIPNKPKVSFRYFAAIKPWFDVSFLLKFFYNFSNCAVPIVFRPSNTLIIYSPFA